MKIILFLAAIAISLSLTAQKQVTSAVSGAKSNPAMPAVKAVQLRYDEIRPFNENWAAFKVDNKWGFVDKEGKIVMEPQFTHEPYLKFGLIHVGIGYQKQAKIYDKQGNLVIDSSPYYLLNGFTDSLYTTACTFGDGAKGTRPERLLFDRTGKIVTQLENEGTYSGSVYCTQTPHEGRIWNCTKASYLQNGYLDMKGKQVIPTIYLQAKDFSNNRAWVKKKTENGQEFWGAIDTSGIEVVPFIFKHEPKRDFSMNRCFAWMGDGYILIDNTGKTLTETKFKGAANFTSKDVTVARIEENYEEVYLLLDYNGKVVKLFEKPAPATQKEQVIVKSGFNNGLATASWGIFGKMGAIDKTGKTIIPFDFESIDAFACERATALKTDKTGMQIEGVIDTHGNFVIIKSK